MAGMTTRALVSVAAWLTGVVAATSGTVVAVSLIGQGINTSPVNTLSVDDVNHALADISQPPDPSAAASSQPAVAASSAEPSPSLSASASASPSRSASPHAGGSAAPLSAPRTLTSSGGSVIAVCTSAGAYLSSWSPAQGYQVAEVRRGPAAVARVEFQAGTTETELAAVCHAGVPVAFYGSDDASRSPDE